MPQQLHDGTHMHRAKVGLIAGAGNMPAHPVAAVLTFEGQVMQASPGYPAYRAGHVLVNRRGGRPCSVIVLALYLRLWEPKSLQQ